MESMKTPPAINLPDAGTPAQRLDMAFRRVLTVSKEDLLKAEQEEKSRRESLRRERNPNALGGRTRQPGPSRFGDRKKR